MASETPATFKLQHPGSCTGMFWRNSPSASLKHRVEGSQPDWPRNGALLRGFVHDISPAKVQENHLWLEVVEFAQAGSKDFVPSPNAWMQFAQGGALLHKVE